jgi:hypothetical protein
MTNVLNGNVTVREGANGHLKRYVVGDLNVSRELMTLLFHGLVTRDAATDTWELTDKGGDVLAVWSTDKRTQKVVCDFFLGRPNERYYSQEVGAILGCSAMVAYNHCIKLYAQGLLQSEFRFNEDSNVMRRYFWYTADARA